MTIVLDAPENTLLVSHSQIGTWNDCSFKWHLNYEKNWTQKVTPEYFDRGHMIHEGLAEYYQGLKDGKGTIGDASFLNNMIRQWVSRGFDLTMINAVGKLLTRYIEEWSPENDKGMEVLEVEKHLIMDLLTPKGRKYTLQGYLDLLVKVNEHIWLVDHKSTGASKPKSQASIDMDTQLPTYAYILGEQGLPVTGMVFNMLNTYDYKNPASPDKLFGRHVMTRTRQEQTSLLREMGLVVDEMYERRDNPRRSLGHNCERCAFQEPCLATMRGLDLDTVMPANFKQKEGRATETEMELA